MPVHFVLFDLDDVMWGYDKGAFRQQLANLTGRSLPEVVVALYDSGLDRDADSGHLSPAEHLGGMATRLGQEIAEADWAEARRRTLVAWPDMLDLVRTVKGRIGVGAFSNNSFLFRKHIRSIYPQLIPLFGDNILVSADIGLCKPEPEAYLAALQRLGAAPATTLFVDDKLENVTGAEKAGLKGHVFIDPPDLWQRLHKEGVL